MHIKLINIENLYGRLDEESKLSNLLCKKLINIDYVLLFDELFHFTTDSTRGCIQIITCYKPSFR